LAIRHDDGGQVEHGEAAQVPAPRKQKDGEDRAEEAAVERHASAPYGEHLGRLRQVDVEVVEQDVADAAAENDAEGDPHDEVVDVGERRAAEVSPQRRVRGEPAGVVPAAQEPDHVRERVPADREGADGDCHGVDGGEGQGEEHGGAGVGL
jgi:hypothetical protein